MSEPPLQDQSTPAAPAAPAPVAVPAAPVAPVAPVAPALEYDRSGNHVTRGQFRVLLILMFVNTVAIVGYLCVPSGATWARQTWRDFQSKRAAQAAEQRRLDARLKRIADFRQALPALAAMKWPKDTPVYTEDNIEAASLLASDSAYETIRIDRNGMPAELWQVAVGRTAPPEVKLLAGFVGSDPGSPSSRSGRDNFVMIHARKNPAGAERLVWCELEARQSTRQQQAEQYRVMSSRTLRVRLVSPGSETAAPSLLQTVDTEFDQRDEDYATVKRGGEAKTPQTFRMLAGIPDPADPTRCTIPYVLNGLSGAFDVRVLEGDRLLVEPSHGRITERSGSTRVAQHWEPDAPRAVRYSDVQTTPR